MAFQIRTQKDRLGLPNGRYIIYQSREWMIKEVTINNSGLLCLKLNDPIRFENQVVTVCSLGDIEILLQAKQTGQSGLDQITNNQND